MDKVEHELPEKVVVVVWDWISVQLPLDKISLFIEKIRSTIAENLDDYQLRECAFVVYCDARFTPLAITRELAKSSNVDIHHTESHDSSWVICKKLHRFHADYDPGIVALISGASIAYGPILTKLSRYGWRIQLFHPENAPRDYLDYGDHNRPIEQLLEDDEIGNNNNNININFPHTVHFLVSELWNSEELLGFLSNVTEQYQSKVVYFNQKVAEAIVELKAFDIESAVSLLEARIRACLPTHGIPIAASTGGACRLEIITDAHFLDDIKIARLIKEINGREPNIPYPNATMDMGTYDGRIGNSLNATTTSSLAIPYPMMPSSLSFMQQLAFPFYSNINSPITAAAHSDISSAIAVAAVCNFTAVAAAAAAAATAATTAITNIPTYIAAIPNVTYDPYLAKQMATAATQIFQQQNEFQQQLQANHHNTVNGYHHYEGANVADDSKSHKEVKIEVFSEDENDYGDEEDDDCVLNRNGNRNSWRPDCDKNLIENTRVMRGHQTYGTTAAYDMAEYMNEYPALPTAESGNALCYSAVVKGIKPFTNNNNKSFNPNRECSNVTTQRRASASTQISQWDQMIVERGGKFSKPAPQCIHWNNPKHRLDFPCRFWHPREQCRYYPNCSNTADECGFAHPFCGDFCRCPKGKRDPQKNHRVLEERYYGSGDRMKHTGNNNNNNAE